VTAQRRSVQREQSQQLLLSDQSLNELALQFPSRTPSPSELVSHLENRDRVRGAMLRLSETDREILVLRFLEHLSPPEIAAVLGIREGAVRTRQLRALQRLQSLLRELEGEAS
jgi:RNA polymerase sigma-70 factor (ECF subfamily)